MTSAEMAAYGAEGTWALLREHEIRWSECDLYGHVNHTAYLTLFEDLRVDYWRAISGTDLSSAQPGPVMAQLEVRYAKPVGASELVPDATAECKLTPVPLRGLVTAFVG
jgi:acyl-CoA thioesterase FadM